MILCAPFVGVPPYRNEPKTMRPEPRASNTRKKTRIQREKEEAILESALDVFSAHGFRGSTIDQIAELAGMSKPNLLYYFSSKEAIIRALIDRLLAIWLEPLVQIDPDGAPLDELQIYIERKLEMSQNFPRESRLFATEILQGAPHISDDFPRLKTLVDEKASVIDRWIARGRLKRCDPYHLIFSIWATTQHYADFDVQVRAVLGPRRDNESRFEDARVFLNKLFVEGLDPSN